VTIQEELIGSLKQLLEICRCKCSPTDEVILPDNITNEAAMIRAMRVLAQAGAPDCDCDQCQCFGAGACVVPMENPEEI
jgi:hypothetical protein